MSTDIDPPPRVPGERRLAHPPSDRYRTAEAVEAAANVETMRPTSTVRGLAYGLAAAAGGALAIVLLGGVLAVSAGLLVAAAAMGWAIAAGLRTGAGVGIAQGRRTALAAVLAVVAVLAGQLGLWGYALSEGGVLGPLDYLAETFGPLVLVEVGISAVVAWISAR